MDPTVAAAMASGGASAGAATVGGITGLLTNKKNRSWNNRQAEKQRAFQQEMWNAANVYNSPMAQMNRFKEAGLNPHLIYGKGTPGNAAGSPSGAKANVMAENPFPADAAQGIVQTAMAGAMQQAQRKNIQADTLLKASQNLKALADAKGKDWSNKLAEKTFNDNVQAAQERTKQLIEGTRQSRIQTTIANETMQNKIDMVARDLKIKEAIETGKNLDNVYKAYQARLAEKNINVNDPLVSRQVQLYFDNLLQELKLRIPPVHLW